MLAREDRTHRQEILQHLPVSYREREREKGEGVHVLHISTQNLCVCVYMCFLLLGKPISTSTAEAARERNATVRTGACF